MMELTEQTGLSALLDEHVRFNIAKANGVTNIPVRGDSAYGNQAVIGAARRGRARFSVVLAKQASVNRAIDSIADDAWVPVKYPGSFTDPDTGQLVSDAQVAEVAYTAFAGTRQAVTARLIVRRSGTRRFTPKDELFPAWRYHPFFTNNTEPVADADITHRRHAVVETLFADLVDGPFAHVPSGSFQANSAWVVLAAITHNLLRAAGALAGKTFAVARGARCAGNWSTCPPGSSDRRVDPLCDYPPTGRPPRHGTSCGTTSSPQRPRSTSNPICGFRLRPEPVGPTRPRLPRDHTRGIDNG